MSGRNLTKPKPPPLEDDYYLSYDYDPSNDTLKSDSLLIPNPEEMDPKGYTVDVLPNVELPDDSLADPDLKDHNCIDNIMYVYYGGNGKTNKSYGPEIVISGSGLSCAAQLLTFFCVLLAKYYRGRKICMMLIVVHIFFSMFLANLFFILGVYVSVIISQKNVIEQKLISVHQRYGRLSLKRHSNEYFPSSHSYLDFLVLLVHL